MSHPIVKSSLVVADNDDPSCNKLIKSFSVLSQTAKTSQLAPDFFTLKQLLNCTENLNYQSISIFSGRPTQFVGVDGAKILAKVITLLAPGAQTTLKLLVPSRYEDLIEFVQKEFIYAGFLDVMLEEKATIDGLIVIVTANSPKFSVIPATTLDLAQGGVIPLTTKDCSTRPKPCANCTCGRAKQAAASAEDKTIEAPSSSCGNCYLGDAFRCEACPYKGLPAFAPGDKVTLPQTF